MDWEEYEPKDAREFDQCYFCRAGKEHTVKQHTQEVKRAQKEELKRENALYRTARKQYDRP